MVEASISWPIIILTIMLLIRVFVFNLDILSTGISEHEKALDRWDSFDGELLETYENDKEIYMLKGGLLNFDLKKIINTKAYFFNEDNMVRINEML